MDDNSPDGTALVIGNIMMRGNTKCLVKLITRPEKRGLSSAVLDGMKQSSGKYIVVMDADLQHPPEVIPRLIQALEEGADLSVGSRRIRGGISEGLSPAREVSSLLASLLARLILPRARSVKDPVSGFFALKRSVICDTLEDRRRFVPSGYKVLLQILCRTSVRKVVEVPFIFEARRSGYSKLNSNEVIEYLRLVTRLALAK